MKNKKQQKQSKPVLERTDYKFVRLDGDLYQKITSQAQEYQETFSQILRRILRQFDELKLQSQSQSSNKEKGGDNL
jgi:negative regulator of replication initiation